MILLHNIIFNYNVYILQLLVIIGELLLVVILQVYFGTQHSRVYILASIKGENCANGMSWLVRKHAIKREGGLLAFSGYLAEDFFMGKALWQKYGVLCTYYIIRCLLSQTGGYIIGEYLNSRMH